MEEIMSLLESDWEQPVRRLLIYFLLDVSGSMCGPPIYAVQQGIEFLVREFQTDPGLMEIAHISVITFGSTAEVVLPLTPISEVPSLTLTCGGSTNMAGALNLLTEQIERDFRPPFRGAVQGDYKPMIFLLTDGEPNDLNETIAASDALKQNSKIGSLGPFIAFGCGPKVSAGSLQRIAKSVMTLPEVTTDNIGDAFRWIASSISVAGNSVIRQVDGGVNATKVAVTGEESLQNLRLSSELRKLVDKQDFFRYFDLQSLQDFLSRQKDNKIIVFIDLFSLDLKEVTDLLAELRTKYSRVVFCLYLDKQVEIQRWNELPSAWQTRLRHYFRLYQEPDDVEFEPIVRKTFYQAETEAKYNFKSGNTKSSHSDEIEPSLHDKTEVGPKEVENTIFISYSRSDWESFVRTLVETLSVKGFKIWVDQNLIVGGEDWMDSIGEALDECTLLILIISPDAMSSKYVRMEYRYFFNHDKPIIPLLLRETEKIPPEISTIQYLDFLDAGSEPSYEHLYKVLRHHIKG